MYKKETLFLAIEEQEATYSSLYQMLGWCRATLRKYIQQLERDGLVTRIPGAGRERDRFIVTNITPKR